MASRSGIEIECPYLRSVVRTEKEKRGGNRRLGGRKMKMSMEILEMRCLAFKFEQQ
jgi:hypothetical protein